MIVANNGMAGLSLEGVGWCNIHRRAKARIVSGRGTGSARAVYQSKVERVLRLLLQQSPYKELDGSLTHILIRKLLF